MRQVKSENIVVRVTPEDRAVLQTVADGLRVSLSEYVRSSVAAVARVLVAAEPSRCDPR